MSDGPQHEYTPIPQKELQIKAHAEIVRDGERGRLMRMASLLGLGAVLPVIGGLLAVGPSIGAGATLAELAGMGAVGALYYTKKAVQGLHRSHNEDINMVATSKKGVALTS